MANKAQQSEADAPPIVEDIGEEVEGGGEEEIEVKNKGLFCKVLTHEFCEKRFSFPLF